MQISVFTLYCNCRPTRPQWISCFFNQHLFSFIIDEFFRGIIIFLLNNHPVEKKTNYIFIVAGKDEVTFLIYV